MGTWVCNYHLCCFLYPLKKGLLVWGYMNLIRYCLLDGITTTLSANRIRFHFLYDEELYSDITSITLMFLVTFALSLSNLVFNIIFVVGIHKNEDKKLRQHYFFWLVKVVLYAIFIVVANILRVVFLDVRLWLSRHVDPVTHYLTIENPAVGTLAIVVQIYFIALIRAHYKSDKTDQKAIVDFFNWEADHHRVNKTASAGGTDMGERTEDTIDEHPAPTRYSKRF